MTNRSMGGADYIAKNILFFGHRVVLACDGKCGKAWGLNTRPRVDLDAENPDDFYWLADDELGVAPQDPGTYEGFHAKPSPTEKLESKWCARECERSGIFDPGEAVVLPDLRQRLYNIKNPNSVTQEGPES